MTSSHPSDQHSHRYKYLPKIVIYLLMAILGAGLTLAVVRLFPTKLVPQDIYQNPEINASATQSIPPKVTTVTTTSPNFVVAAIKLVGPAVVRIDTERTVRPRFYPWFDDPFLRPFFGREMMPGTPQFRLFGEGSGFIIESNGLILTNAHVVSGVDKVKVTLKDGRSFQGEVRGIDKPFDLAVIKIKGQNLPVAPLGDSNSLQVGDWAIAVGNPFGLDNTVTLGIISTLKRSSSQVGIPDKRIDFIQTDAAINPGNSGGPLLNQAGQVIGINTAIRARAEGIGFAIPINTAKRIKDVLARGEKVSHPYIGISMASLNPEFAKRLNRIPDQQFTVPEIEGVLVMRVLINTPAESAGLLSGDVITQVNGQKITNAEQLQSLVAKTQVGKPLKLTLQRQGKTQTISVIPRELSDIDR